MSKTNKKQKRRQKKKKAFWESRWQEKQLLEAYQKELLENMNFRLVCDMETEALPFESLLWVDEITIGRIAYSPQKKLSVKAFFLSVFQKILKRKEALIWE